MRKLYSLRKVCLSTVLLLAIGATGTSYAQDAATMPGKSLTPQAPPATKGDASSASIAPKLLEDWTTPSLQGSDLKAFAVLSGDVDTLENAFTHEVTRVQWRPSDPIDLYIIKPLGVKNPPVIVYLYSFPFETDRFLNHDFCKLLTKNGFAAVGFASALTGHRYHDRPMKEWFVSELSESLATSAHDVQMILNYLETRGDLDLNRVGMFGDGSGATIAILAASVDPRIKTLDLLNPWGDWPDWMASSTRIPENERANFVKPAFLELAAPLDPVKWLPQLKTPKVRLQFVQSVTVTPAASKKKVEAAAPAQAQIVHYADAQAFLAAISGDRGFDWIKAQIQPDFVHEYRAGDPQSRESGTKSKVSQ